MPDTGPVESWATSTSWLRRPLLVLVVLVLAAGPSLAAGPGAKFYQQLVEQEGLYDDPEWQAYVQEVGDRLLEVTPHHGREYHFFVVDSPIVNASAYPDAYIFIYRGLIAYLRSEDELAFVIGHEIGHVVGRHTARQQSSKRVRDIAGFVGSILAGTSAIQDLSNTATAEALAGYGREFELEADGYGAEYLTLAGYNSLSAIDAVHVLKDHSLFAKNVLKQPTVYHGLHTTHPKNDKRLHDVVLKSQHLFPEELREPERDFWGMMNGVVYGNESATGLIKGQSYYHGTLRVVVTFPDGWDVSNTTAEVLGRAPGGTTDITVQRLGAPNSPMTPAEYLTGTLKRDDLTNGKDVEVNGFTGHEADIVLAEGSSAQVRKIALVFKDSSAYLFKGEVGPGGDLQAFEANWQATLHSFRAMTAADLKIANDQRIMVVVAKPSDTFASLAQKSSIKSYPEETLRVINGQHPVGEPRAGDYVKIVQ